MSKATFWLSNVRDVRDWRLEWLREDWRSLPGGTARSYAYPERQLMTSATEGGTFTQGGWVPGYIYPKLPPGQPIVVDDHGEQPGQLSIWTTTGKPNFEGYDTGTSYSIHNVRFDDGDEFTIPLIWKYTGVDIQASEGLVKGRQVSAGGGVFVAVGLVVAAGLVALALARRGK